MANRLTHILDAIRTKDYAVATESIAQVLQQKVEQSLAQERARLASTLVREAVTNPAVAKFSAEAKDPRGCSVCGSKSCPGASDKKKCPQWLKEDAKTGHLSGQGWPDKKTAEYWAEKVRKYDDRKITVVPPEKGEKWWRIHYGPELDEGFGDSQERVVRHTCKGCGNYWMGPAYEDECPKCFKRQFEMAKEDCGKSHIKEGKCSQCGTDRNPVDSLLGDVCGKCARDNHKKATGKK